MPYKESKGHPYRWPFVLVDWILLMFYYFLLNKSVNSWACWPTCTMTPSPSSTHHQINQVRDIVLALFNCPLCNFHQPDTFEAWCRRFDSPSFIQFIVYPGIIKLCSSPPAYNSGITTATIATPLDTVRTGTFKLNNAFTFFAQAFNRRLILWFW